ncbi:MAG: hypothetical protein J7K33_10440 [Candidatus Marinimicrobia bacterium]|nr:hypothetical protein [Candidatus Neomarinimicrobiota bacterium]
MKRVDFKVFLVLIFAGLILFRCGLFERREEDYEVFVEVEDIFCTEVVLRVGLPDSGGVNSFNVVRDDSVVGVYSTSDNDTVIIDGGLMPDRDYEYRVDLVDGGRVRVSSESVVVHTLDTTSHEFDWEIDTLGIYGSYLSDVWIVDEDNIWVVGNIVVPDPDSSWNGTGRETFNAAHWNGEKWEYIHIRGNLMNDVGPLNSIWYFDENNIWVAGFPIHWDGNKWTLYHLQDMGLDVSVDYIWASSPDDIYFVGLEGSIVHYDGKDFKKIETEHEVRLIDIEGTDDGEYVYVVGYDFFSPAYSVVYQIHDGVVETLFYDEIHPTTGGLDWGAVSSVSVYKDMVYFVTYLGLVKKHVQSDEFTIDFAFRNYGYRSMVVKNYNDIFMVGGRGKYAHFNGVSWDFNEELKNIYDLSSIWGGCAFKDNLVVICGYLLDGSHGYVAKGRRQN